MRILDKKQWPHKVTVRDLGEDYYTQMIEWIGLRVEYRNWNIVERGNLLDFYFVNGNDATMFALRYSDADRV